MESIKVENLTFTYPGAEKPALNNLSFAIEKGEFITICGKSGCGKSTLLRHLKPTLLPYGERNGKVMLGDREISSLSDMEQTTKIGFVFQNPDNQIVTDKVWHEMAFGLESLGIESNEIRGRVAEMATFFGIQNWFHRDVVTLSGGQKQLLNLASVMVMQPSVLVLDEPTSQLDPIAAQEFLRTIYKINQELGVTVILSEHRLEDAFPLSDRVIVLTDGEVTAFDSPRKIGEILKDKNDDMKWALPTPMRVFLRTGIPGECPVTVREGRQWLSQVAINNHAIKNEKPEPAKGEPILQFRDVWFRYDKNMPDVIKGLSTKVYEREIYAIVGGNGMGKTTALLITMGIYQPYRGKVNLERGKRIMALPQNPQSLFSEKTVALELREGSEGVSDIDSRIDEVIKVCDLKKILHRHPYDLSGGEQQRLALSKVLLRKPDILLLDEPTKGLDAHFKMRFGKLLKQLQQQGMTIVLVSHDIEFCARYADRCAMFFDGEIVSEDTPRQFFSGKNFYTTVANRMAREIINDVILDEDIVEAFTYKGEKGYED